ncbi:MAG: spermidine/putrescine transporter ATP-binding protein [Ilumatobacteraceae bacterium]|nr:spermidine/putrescine transporter ATP-binding protein [Ilumatobacteraceae bacterium]
MHRDIITHRQARGQIGQIRLGALAANGPERRRWRFAAAPRGGDYRCRIVERRANQWEWSGIVSEPVASTIESSTTIRTSPAIQLVRLRKTFSTSGGSAGSADTATVVAVDDVDLEIGQGEFFSLLGPSGSGKTTVLRMIAGFELPTGGAVLLDGVDVTQRAPYDRDVNTVFQDYALFPHMTVQRNVEYGLKVKGVGKAERRKRAGEMLESVRLGGYGNRRPTEMSGGQRQRVALARALVNRPKVLLLDEPLGALDLKLREEMQGELKAIQHDVGITFVFVTHDQGEALSMSSRVAVFNNGRIEQVGTPRDIYERPTTSFVANFVGTSNVLPSALSQRLLGIASAHTLRPERIRLVTDGDGIASDEVAIDAIVDDVQYLGADSRVRAHTDDGSVLIAAVSSDGLGAMSLGQSVRLAWSRAAATVVVESAPPISNHELDPAQQGENQ